MWSVYPDDPDTLISESYREKDTSVLHGAAMYYMDWPERRKSNVGSRDLLPP
jgi:hypothetical protein